MNFICSYIVLQHVRPRYAKQYIKEFLRVLAPQGLLVFQLPSEFSDAQNSRERRIIRPKSLKPFLPPAAVNLYRRVVYFRQPIMDMFAIPRDRLVKFLKENGATIVDVRPDSSAGKEWTSFRYCLTKT
jgi:SAM-dependent methyltransferase